MAREALSNVGRHARAATCRLSLRGEPGFAVLEVDDDGQGFVRGAGTGGWGPRNLDERAEWMGGSLDVASVPGEGTTVRLRIPEQRTGRNGPIGPVWSPRGSPGWDLPCS